jgi:hypothetical protein
LGIFAFSWCLCVVNRGEVVVECVVNVVCCRSLFRGLKVGHLFQLYFQTADTEYRGFLSAWARFGRFGMTGAISNGEATYSSLTIIDVLSCCTGRIVAS